MTGSLRPWYILLFAVPAALFALKNFDGTVTFSDFYLSDKGWVFVSAQGTVWNTLWSVYTAVALGTAIIYLVAHSRRIELQREKKQTRLLIIFSALSMALMEADYLLHDHFIDLRTVSLTPLLLIPWVAGYVIAIKRFHFLNLTTDMVTRQILETINELVILVDSDGKPTYMNAKALEFFQKPLRKIDEIRTDELLLQTDEGESLLPRVYEGGIVKKRIAFGTSDSENTQTVLDMEITHIYDRFNDPLGFLLIGRKVQSLESLQSQYNLTEREADVVGCIINGWKTQVIAEYLEISERTVKTHISNIYQKLGVTNRVSLINILGQGEGH
jgi:DNA-binding CsgD family transcriptional regulator